MTAADKAFRTYASELQRYRSDSLDEAKLLSLRAVLARGRKNYGQAEALFRQTIEVMEHTPHASPVEIAVERGNLAVALDKEKRYAESLAESERAIAILEQAAPRHPSLVASLNNAACSLADLGRRDESERVFQRALAAAADLYGEDNRVTAKIMLSYARVLRENKESPAAADWQKRGVEVYRRSLMRDNGTVDMEELAGDRSNGESLAHFGESHENIKALVCRYSGDRAPSGGRPGYGNSWNLWITRTSQLHREGKLTEAAESGKRALALARNFGPADSRLPVSYHLLGCSLSRLGTL